ncbi:hypothetical protein ACLB2K_039789 [Fragaria x ananassa]
MLRSPGFDKLMFLEEFNNASNGYVIDDTCVFGAKVFVCNERTKGKRERLLRMNNAIMYKHVWKVKNFSKLDDQCYKSEPFTAGNQKWEIKFYPKGSHQGMGTHFSLYFGKQCFSAKSSSWGFPKFITLCAFSEANKGLMIKNTYILEAEVTVHGIARVRQP